MITKACSCCSVVKEASEFCKKNDGKDGLASACKACRKVQKAAEYLRDREKVLVRVAVYRNANQEKVSAGKARCYQNKKAEYQAKHKAHYEENKDQILLACKEYRVRNAEAVKARQTSYREANRKKLNDAQKAYYLENRTERLLYSNDYQRARIKADPIYAVSRLVRRRIAFALADRGYAKKGRTAEMLGCDYAALKSHLELQFLQGMTWDNRCEWHIDHIIPLASAVDEADLLALCHYTNLQPLWALDNLCKGSKILAVEV